MYMPVRSRETLLPIFQKYVFPSTTFLDQWAAYNTIGNEGFQHQAVNHSIEFVSDNGCCTNAIEGLWDLIKL